MEKELIDWKGFIEFWQKRYNPKMTFLFLVIYVAGIIFVFLPATEKMNENPFFVVAWFVLFLTYLLAMPHLWNRIFYGKPDPQFLKCPFCKKPLGGNNRHTVVATGKCGYCGNQIVKDCEQRAALEEDLLCSIPGSELGR